MSSTQLIVVGVDGSADSRTALEYALEEATLRDASVRVVTVFESSGMFGVRYGLPLPMPDERIAARIRPQIQAMIDQALAGRPAPPEVGLTVVAGGSTARILVTEADAADLLVVGHRGLGGFSSALLGSVGLQCVLHATRPVVVVRPRREAPAEPVAATAAAAAE